MGYIYRTGSGYLDSLKHDEIMMGTLTCNEHTVSAGRSKTHCFVDEAAEKKDTKQSVNRSGASYHRSTLLLLLDLSNGSQRY